MFFIFGAIIWTLKLPCDVGAAYQDSETVTRLTRPVYMYFPCVTKGKPAKRKGPHKKY
jgi:hypothetical protein